MSSYEGIKPDDVTLERNTSDPKKLQIKSSAALDNNARVKVRKSGVDVGTRRAINLIEGSGVTLTVTDDAANEEVEVTIAASGGGGDDSLGIYGDGSDGDVAIAGTTSLGRTMYYEDLTVQSGGVLQPASMIVHCELTCTVDSGGAIRRNGANASGSASGGGAGGATIFGQGFNGGNGSTVGAGANGNASTNSAGGAGGNGGSGNGGANAGGTGGTVTRPTNAGYRSIWTAQCGATAVIGASQARLNGGGGGGGGGFGGGGGAGAAGGGGGSGAPISILARSLVNNGDIEAKGGDGANGGTNAGGGGGGGGGALYLTYHSKSGTGNYSVAGGAKGLGNGTGTDGVDGSAGLIFEFAMAA
jgi:hypothetical protein